LKLFALDGFQPTGCLAQKEDLSGIVDVLDEVVDAAVMVERVVELKLPLAAGLVDQRDVLWEFCVFSQTSVSGGGRGGLGATS
jgi:hypothetical protein